MLKNNILVLLVTSLSIAVVGYFVYTLSQKSTAVPPLPDTAATTTTSKNKEFKIVAFGDSLTAGLNVDLKDSYPSILEATLQSDAQYKKFNRTFKVVNMGVSGETTTGGLERVDFVLAQKPDLILLGLGANDMLRSVDPSIVSTNLNQVIKKLRATGVPVIVLGMQSVLSNGFGYKRDFDAIYPKLAKTYKLPLVPFFLEGVALIPSLNTSDGIHPNRAGYEMIITKNILPVLEPELNLLITK